MVGIPVPKFQVRADRRAGPPHTGLVDKWGMTVRPTANAKTGDVCDMDDSSLTISQWRSTQMMAQGELWDVGISGRIFK